MDRNRDRRNNLSLDGLNFFLADVRDGLGPYLAIYLLAVHRWDPASIGVVMTVAAMAGLVAQAPAGALIDRVRSKRAVVAVAALAVTLGCLVLPFTSSFGLVALTQALGAVAASVFAPAIAAISLGITGARAFTRRTGRNETFNHAGNACAALLAGGFAWLFGPIAVFYLMAAMALASIVAVSCVSDEAIDHDVARGLEAGQLVHGPVPSTLRVLLDNRTLLLFAICCGLFHLANAAMLPLVSQKLAQANVHLATPLTSACIVAAQLVMVPMAWLVGVKADAWGRKPLLLAGFLILPIRGVLYVLSNDPYWLVAVQLLDGIGAGLFGALFPLVVKDLTQGTGRFNVSLGVLSTVFGIGAALSNSLAGFVVQGAGYSAAFLTLAAIAALAFGLLLAMPETFRPSRVTQADTLAVPDGGVA
ncbi:MULTISPECIES: MFS transporter [unclassified Pseudomonas]|uniref:MFS transporter n=1 Tax=unclassified Pseudomonas TaxID=196821 RepID=UPI000876BAC8|nr:MULTISPECIES: MFS transporter [unclassified Pseudomonas]SCZ20042.1 Predicted arabinose efflux permease, MFS family [Pseudomonas sp. NFACC44-2]SDA45107.1 Predicted arabinose efflux permease, MFS family [Pseudomonas sp. NFACC51]SFH06703.1 Predicted arabinose efflux permease, MFS family [Pseudomonas sp. NFACC54]SFS40999.1 Predicted arabinose efflux permease, MFS family [Pseudomonas sp. NFACC48-1]